MYWINIEKIGYISKISEIFDFFDIFDFFEKNHDFFHPCPPVTLLYCIEMAKLTIRLLHRLVAPSFYSFPQETRLYNSLLNCFVSVNVTC